jgi:hypothetical protein
MKTWPSKNIVQLFFKIIDKWKDKGCQMESSYFLHLMDARAYTIQLIKLVVNPYYNESKYQHDERKQTSIAWRGVLEDTHRLGDFCNSNLLQLQTAPTAF